MKIYCLTLSLKSICILFIKLLRFLYIIIILIQHSSYDFDFHILYKNSRLKQFKFQTSISISISILSNKITYKFLLYINYKLLLSPHKVLIQNMTRVTIIRSLQFVWMRKYVYFHG